jgi:hypothetical protein
VTPPISLYPTPPPSHTTPPTGLAVVCGEGSRIHTSQSCERSRHRVLNRAGRVCRTPRLTGTIRRCSNVLKRYVLLTPSIFTPLFLSHEEAMPCIAVPPSPTNQCTLFNLCCTLRHTGVNALENILIDRLYNAGTPVAGTRPPVFPFEKVNVTAIKPIVAAVGQAAAAGGNR